MQLGQFKKKQNKKSLSFLSFRDYGCTKMIVLIDQ